MQSKNLLILFFLFCLACKNSGNEKFDKKEEKFDKVKWAVRVENEYPFRDRMLKDFIASYQLTGLKKTEILNLLGEPTYTDTGYLFYRVSRQFLGSFPIPFHTRTLVIKFKGDSTVEWRKIHQ